MKEKKERVHEFNNPAKSSPQIGKRRRKKNKSKLGKTVGLFLVAIQAVLTAVFGYIVYSLGMLPMKFFMVIMAVLVVLLGITYFTQHRHKNKAIPGKIFSILISLILGAGCYYLGMVNGAFDEVAGGNSYKIDNMVVAVLAEDSAETINDARDYTFGVQYALGAKDVESAVADINKALESEIQLVECEDIQAQAAALLAGETGAIIYNEGYTGMLEEAIEGYPEKVKIIYRYEIKKEIENSKSEKVDTAKSTFSVYISGIDVYGPIETNSRSDVNIIVTVNPETRQILLTTTPRDFYVPIPGISGGQRDKLTHAGIYGVDASISTLESLYDTTIPFYLRVNFTSLIDIVDALGGVDVYSQYSFTTLHGSMVVHEGMNHFNGEQALYFSRERYSLPGGDNQRGKNQQAVIVAMIKKMISPQILMSAGSILDSVSGNVDTNMSQEQIQKLIKTQLNEGGSWNIYSVAATGTGDSNSCYSSGSRMLYVMNPNQESVNNIINLMRRVENGEILEGSEVAK